MAIENDKEFELKLAQLCRFYRCLREVWARTNAEDTAQVQKWIVFGGKIIDKTTVLLAELEDYTGSLELRTIWDNLNEIQQKRNIEAGRT